MSGDDKVPEQKEDQIRHTLHGDPRGAFVDGIDTTAPAPHHAPKNTGVHGVGTGDPRAAWQANPTVESAEAWQEEKDFRRAIAESIKDQGHQPIGPEDYSEAGPGPGDGRAGWLLQDTAHGGRHNWHKKEKEADEPKDIRDPRAP